MTTSSLHPTNSPPRRCKTDFERRHHNNSKQTSHSQHTHITALYLLLFSACSARRRRPARRAGRRCRRAGTLRRAAPPRCRMSPLPAKHKQNALISIFEAKWCICNVSEACALTASCCLISSSVTSRMYLAGLPAHSWPAGITIHASTSSPRTDSPPVLWIPAPPARCGRLCRK